MTPREQLLAEAADLEAAAAQKRQAAAALDAKPDWRNAAKAFWQGAYPGHEDMHPDTEAEVVRGLIAALPLAPLARAPMGEGEIEALARELRQQYENTLYSTEEAIALVIRATLTRVPVAAWPGEAELRAFRAWAASLTVTDMNEIVADNGITAGMVVTQEAAEQVRRLDRLIERMTGEQP